jgi:formimidoylglutamate deiminase
MGYALYIQASLAMSNRKFRFDHALLPGGVATDVVIEVDAAGWIFAAGPAQPGDRSPRIAGFALPGLPNVHSHAHQRAMAGRAEVAGEGPDSFWTWRERMYANALRLSPDDLEAIAAQAYVEMLKAGFTAVGEFQYLHHQPDGQPYANPGEMTLRCLAAARDTGMAITLLPVFYAHGGFGPVPAADRQRQFVTGVDSFLALHAAVRVGAGADPETVVGLAPHSLRAVSAGGLAAVVAALPDGPVHIHVAEQVLEVEECLEFAGRRPVELLLDTVAVDSRWCAIHATHMTHDETRRLARSGAVAGLCPVTEANLGDGLFEAVLYRQEGGAFGVGTDSNVEITAAGELRLLEYGQRLKHRARNVLAAPGRSTGATLIAEAATGGARALGRPMGALTPGRRADMVVLDTGQPALAGQPAAAVPDCWVFAGPSACVRDVYVAGRQVVSGGHHRDEERILARYRQTLNRLNG